MRNRFLMNTFDVVKTTSKTVQKKWATDEGNISLDELKRGIKKAEQGPFYTTEEAKKLLKKWRASKRAQ